MNKFEIKIMLDKKIFNEKLEKRVQYHPGKYDNIVFNGNNITIEGNRTKSINAEECLKTIKSNYYRDIMIALLYAYFKKGEFSIKSAHLIVQNGKKRMEKRFPITQRFCNCDPTYFNFDKELEILFCDDRTIAEMSIRALSYLNLSISDENHEFNNSWKAFNSLLRSFSNSTTDFEQMKELRKVMDVKFSEFERVVDMCNNVSDADLDKCETIEMLNNNFEKNDGPTINKFLCFINDFVDERVCRILSIKMKCKKNNIVDFEKELAKLNVKIGNKTSNNLDIVRFLIFKYAYYLRCKYFHAEKAAAEYLFETKESEELNRISKYIQILVADLISYQFRKQSEFPAQNL